MSVRLARESEAKALSELVNTAFYEGDRFFKKEKYFYRLDFEGKGALEVMREPARHCFLVYESSSGKDKELMGAVKVELPEQSPEAWEGKEQEAGEAGQGELSGVSGAARVGSFGMMSVPARFGGRGVGTALLNGVESFLATKLGKGCTVKMPLISLRKDLVKWYGKRGYELSGSQVALPAELLPMCSKEYEGKVFFQFMSKTL